MKKLLYPLAAIVFAMLPALSCNKESAVKVVDLAKLTAEKTSMGEDTHCIGGGTDYKRIGKVTIGRKEGPVIESPFVYQP